jgi:plasmid stabilization system protein ParE
MYKVIIDSKAEQDLVDIFLYITDTLKAPDAAKRLYSKIKKEIAGLASMPNRCVLIAEEPYAQLGVRKLFIENYIAFFLVDETSQEVHVFRILYNCREWHNLI